MFDINSTIALIISFFSGISTIIGAFIIFFSKNNKRLISFSLAFSSGVMIVISLTDLFIMSKNYLINLKGETLGTLFCLFFLSCGIIMAMLINKLIPDPNKNLSSSNDLHKVAFFSMIALIIHNFPEGIATFASGYKDTSLGISVAVAIALHNIPEGISIAVPVYFSTKSKLKALKYTFLSGLAEPIGAFITFLFLKPYINETILSIIFSIVSGIMLYLSFSELIPTSLKYGTKRTFIFGIFLGILLIPLTHIFLH